MIVRVGNPVAMMALTSVAGTSQLIPVERAAAAILTTQSLAINPTDLAVRASGNLLLRSTNDKQKRRNLVMFLFVPQYVCPRP
jgi:hypothetical protein